MAKVIYAMKLSLMSDEATKIMDSKHPKKHFILSSNEASDLKRSLFFFSMCIFFGGLSAPFLFLHLISKLIQL